MYDLSHLEKEWKNRELDLFPYIEGFFYFLRSKEMNLRKAKQKLQKSSPATIVQFLNSDDKDVSNIASTLIQLHPDQELIESFLFYSLLKVIKTDYSKKVGICLAGCKKPKFGLKLLFQILHEFKDLKENCYSVFSNYWHFGTELYFENDSVEDLLDVIFQVITEDLAGYVTNLKAISSLEEFFRFKEDLSLPLTIYYQEQRREIKIAFDHEFRKLGQKIYSFQKLISSQFDSNIRELILLIMPFVGLLRLENDLDFIEAIISRINKHESEASFQNQFSLVKERVESILKDPKKYAYQVFPPDLFLS